MEFVRGLSYAGRVPSGLGQHLAVREPAVPAQRRVAESQGSRSLRGFAARLIELRRTLDAAKLDGELGHRGSAGAGAPNTVSSLVPLGLSNASSAARLSSAAEVNTLGPSFSPAQASFSGISTAGAELAGAYDGSLGNDTLTVSVASGGIVGIQAIQLRITDGQGTQVDELAFSSGYAPGTSVATSFGIKIALSSGLLVAGSSFDLDVAPAQAVDPDASFDGSNGEDPNFESGLGVAAGSLSINGVSVAVLADDSLNDVLARITASAAGVTASFDPASERVVLSQKTPGSTPTVALGADDTGFFEATKLDLATVTPGEDPDAAKRLADVAALAGIANGNFWVNGMDIAVDPAVDSLLDILARIESSGAGATSSYDQAKRRVVITSADSSQPLTLTEGTSGFLAAVSLPELDGADSGPQRRAMRFARPAELRRGLFDIARSLEALFSGDFDTASDVQADLAFHILREKLSAAFQGRAADIEAARLRSKLGVDVAFGDRAHGMLTIDSSRLARVIASRPEELASFLFDTEERNGRYGLLAALEAAIDSISASVATRLGSSAGAIVDQLA